MFACDPSARLQKANHVVTQFLFKLLNTVVRIKIVLGCHIIHFVQPQTSSVILTLCSDISGLSTVHPSQTIYSSHVASDSISGLE